MDPQCLSRVQACFQVELHPSKLHNVEEGVHEHLNSALFRYQDDLQGFLMAYEGVKIKKKNAIIHPYFPLVHLEVKTQALLFKPSVGCKLVGRVIKVAADFIGLLVLGIFNASVASDSIRSEFKCNSATQSWVSKKHPAHEIQLGTDVRFQVVKLQEQAVFFGIFGALTDKDTGAVEYLVKKGKVSADAAAGTSKQHLGLNGVGKGKGKKGADAAVVGSGKGSGKGGHLGDKKKKNKDRHAAGGGLANGGNGDLAPATHAKQAGKLPTLKRPSSDTEPSQTKPKKKRKTED